MVRVCNASLLLAIVSCAQKEEGFCERPERVDANIEWIKDHNIIEVTPVSSENLDFFFIEANKIPVALMSKLSESGAITHIMEGSGVTADPSFTSRGTTFDGRPYSVVAGLGGTTVAPTRIVVNKLYQSGSRNLVLHEYAHTIFFYMASEKQEVFSSFWNSSVEKDILAQESATDYYNSYQEGFAESFSIVHGCASSQEWIAEFMPETYKFVMSIIPEDIVKKWTGKKIF